MRNKNNLSIDKYIWKTKGITLIALIITIIIMLILAGVVLSISLGKNGLFKTAQYAVQENSEATAKEKLELALADLTSNKYTNENYDENEYIDNYLINQGMSIIGDVVIVDNWKFTIDRSVPKIGESLGQSYVKITNTIKEYLGYNENNKYEVIILLVMESETPIESATFENLDGTTFEIKPEVEKMKIAKDMKIELDREYKVTIKLTDGKTEKRTVYVPQEQIKNRSLFGVISHITNNGYYEVKINEDSEDEEVKQAKCNLHVIYYKGDLVLDGITEVKGATLANNIYEFGNKDTDVATENENAKNTVVLKVDGNLTINEGVTLTACKSDDGYGGPKGMVISCSGTITNKGTISMTKRGAKAEGENVYLWQNIDRKYEYVPANGALGGSAQVRTAYGPIDGIDGKNGINRETGGGGSGGAHAGDGTPISHSGAGSTGTSYSGGIGGGGCNSNSYSINVYAGNGSENGGIGGSGRGYRQKSSWYWRVAGGGAGNPGGNGGQNDIGNDESRKGENGTGGLLVIYTNDFYNIGTIESNGAMGAESNDTGSYQKDAGGGSSGGGSINIFYKQNIDLKGKIIADGGDKCTYGSNGGTGSITVGSIATGSFVCEYKNY